MTARWLVRCASMAAGIGLAVAAAWNLREAQAARAEPLPVYGAVPAFSLTDQHAQPISAESLRGSVWIADFIFTRCSGQCPMMAEAMRQLAQARTRRGAVQLVSFTVDPQFDTPAVLASYAQQATAGSSAPWRFVTGDPDAIGALCRDGFHLAFGDDAGSAQEAITHSSRLVVVDEAGQIRGYYDATDAQALEQLRRDLRRL